MGSPVPLLADRPLSYEESFRWFAREHLQGLPGVPDAERTAATWIYGLELCKARPQNDLLWYSVSEIFHRTHTRVQSTRSHIQNSLDFGVVLGVVLHSEDEPGRYALLLNGEPQRGCLSENAARVNEALRNYRFRLMRR
jgi:hypothetical protein